MIRNLRGLLPLTASAFAFSALCTNAFAQLDRNQTGRTQGPTKRSEPRNRQLSATPGWTGGVRFIGQPGRYDYSPAIPINGCPLYLPGYYAGINTYGSYGSYGYGYGAAGFSMSFNNGVSGFGFGYQQSNGYVGGGSYGYGSFGPPPAAPAYAREPIRDYAPTSDRSAFDRQGESRSQRDYRSDRDVPNAAPRPSGANEENDYHLNRKPSPITKNPGLAEAVGDIETAFRTGNTASLEKHVDRDGKLTLQVKGTSRQEMSPADYISMTQVALKVMATVRYELKKVEPASNGAMMVTGTHVLRTEDGQQKTFIVGFILKQRGEVWFITEVSVEPAG